MDESSSSSTVTKEQIAPEQEEETVMPSASSTKDIKMHIAQSSTDGPSECVICGAPAFGVHYMVWSCNGCKTFYRRTIMELWNRRYSCARHGNCPIDVKNRCGCRHCRFQKCVRAGMTFTEINVERKRKFYAQSSLDLVRIIDDGGQVDPMIRELLTKEKQFRVLLTSTLTPVYSNLGQALLSRSSIFDQPMEMFENVQLGPDFHLDFYDWRARILSIIIEWIKSFPEFMGFPPADQHAMVVHSAFALLAFSEAFHTPERFADRLVFPDGLQVTRNFSKGVCIPQNGLIRSMVTVINNILTQIRHIQLTEVEYLFLQTLLLFDLDCISLSQRTQTLVGARRELMLVSLQKHLSAKSGANGSGTVASRMAQLLLRIPNIQKVAMFKRQFFHESAPMLLGEPNCAKSSLAIELANLYPCTSFF